MVYVKGGVRMNIFTILGFIFILGSLIGLLIMSAKYGIKPTLDIYTGKEKKKVLSRIEARRDLIGAEQTAELVEKYSALDNISRTGSLVSERASGSLTQDLFKSSEQVDALLTTLMGNNSATTSSLEVDTSVDMSYLGEEPIEEQTGFLDSDNEPKTKVEVQAQQQESLKIERAVNKVVTSNGIFKVDTIFDNIEL
jgi:hypothetical protein